MMSIIDGLKIGLPTALMFALTPSVAQACSIIWSEQGAYSHSAAVVWGTYHPGETTGRGSIHVYRRDKGPSLRTVPVRWDTQWVDDGVNCPVWQPNLANPKGRFFLRENGDGTYSVDTQSPSKKAKG